MKAIAKIRIIHEIDENPDLGYLKSTYNEDTQTIIKSDQYTQENIKEYGWEKVKKWIDEDTKRIQNYGDTWWFLGIRALAKISIKDNPKADHLILIPIVTPGLWGIENDSDEKSLKEIAEQELNILKDILMELGFTEKEFKEAISEPRVLDQPIDGYSARSCYYDGI
jgi:6-pyruvoyl-tetrahydropterin synthase